MVRDMVRMGLETSGYFVLAARDGEEALEISRKFPSRIHALVSDVVMPKLDGVRLRERILCERPGIKVLLMSGTGCDLPLKEVAFLRKPFQIEDLKTSVRKLLDLALTAP